MIVLAATGHRPDTLGGYGRETDARLLRLARYELDVIKPDWVISGMAQGFDTAIARAAVDLGIPFAAAIPFEGQESRWPQKAQETYRALRAKASWEIVICPEPRGERNMFWAANRMHDRNRWMVDYSTDLLALWDGTPSGTAHCVQYAQTVGRNTIHCWSLWTRCGGDCASCACSNTRDWCGTEQCSWCGAWVRADAPPDAR